MNKNKNRELHLPDKEKAEAVRTGTDDAKFLEGISQLTQNLSNHMSRIIFAVEG